jgi:demethylmenaquinone methyltransferase/2-methoxy-6-polyprenyl-1,4-benzoquinol methylase
MSLKDRPSQSPAPLRLGELDVEAHLSDPRRKQAFVTPMFDVIAPRYDAFTRLFSLGMDAGWKREAVRAAVAHAGDARQALDLACGTGDFVLAIASELAHINVLGLDASPRMIAEAVRRIEQVKANDAAVARRVRVQLGDMMQLDVRAASVALVTAGYGFRNVPDCATAIREVARVLESGGTFVALDFYRPENRVWRKLLLGYLTVAGNTVGWLWHRDPVVYGYISRSIDHFMSWQAFSALLEREGFRVERVIRHLGGGIALHVATRR